MSRTKKGRDALRSSEAHPQTRSIAPSWPERSQGRVPIGRYRPKSAETGETHPLPGAGLRPVRRRGPLASLAAAAHARRARLKTGFFNKIDVKLPSLVASMDAQLGGERAYRCRLGRTSEPAIAVGAWRAPNRTPTSRPIAFQSEKNRESAKSRD